ncbi:MAG: hypothetical protein CL685_02610 [Candidatus Magasanikbacteria bacterium]|nr:hypothetical protein [Candidatus Magasanikbacteria bacterium]
MIVFQAQAFPFTNKEYKRTRYTSDLFGGFYKQRYLQKPTNKNSRMSRLFWKIRKGESLTKHTTKTVRLLN